MAQITQGMVLKYIALPTAYASATTETAKTAALAAADFTDGIELPDLTQFPDLSGSVDTIETTTFAAKVNKTYIDGLRDLGSTLDFEANLTVELSDAVDTLLASVEENGAVCFGIEFPAPLAKRWVWVGSIDDLRPNQGTPNDVLKTTLKCTLTSDLVRQDVE